MISDNKKLLTVPGLMRNLVSTPRGSEFSNELNIIMKFYISKTLRGEKTKAEIVYDL